MFIGEPSHKSAYLSARGVFPVASTRNSSCLPIITLLALDSGVLRETGDIRYAVNLTGSAEHNRRGGQEAPQNHRCLQFVSNQKVEGRTTRKPCDLANTRVVLGRSTVLSVFSSRS